jgi:integrase
LTAARTGEAIDARWRKIDLAARVWIVPAERMKAGKEHRVPLSDRALAILGEAGAPEDFVFSGGKAGRSAIWRCSNCCNGWGCARQGVV